MRDRGDDIARRLVEGLLRGGRGVGSPSAMAPIVASPNPRVTWTGTNRQRVDATVESDDGRAWRVVLDTPDGVRIENLVVFERQGYEPTTGGLAVIVNGPSGAGKSSLMAAVADRSSIPWVRFDEPAFGAVDQEFLIWPETADVLHRGYLRGIAALARAGNRVVTSAAGLRQAWFRDAFEDIPTLYVGLDCPLEVLLAREDGRDGRWGGLAASSLGVHDGWDHDLRLDSSTHTPAELATVVLDELSARRFPV